jgi:hypothetical protein
MSSSHFHDDHNEPVQGRASAYSPLRDGGWTINVWNNDLVGQGGVMTTMEDLQKWDENFYTGTVGGKGFLARQLQRGKLNNDSTISYAFGLEVGSYRGVPMVAHGGSTGGYRTELTRFPSVHTSVATMCNVSNSQASTLAQRVADIVLAEKFSQPVATRAATQQGAAGARPTQAEGSSGIRLTQAEVAAAAGPYYSDELNVTYELSAVGTQLVLHRPRAAADTLRAVDHQTLRGTGLTLRFDRPITSGPVANFTVDNGRARGLEFSRTKR